MARWATIKQILREDGYDWLGGVTVRARQADPDTPDRHVTILFRRNEDGRTERSAYLPALEPREPDDDQDFDDKAIYRVLVYSLGLRANPVAERMGISVFDRQMADLEEQSGPLIEDAEDAEDAFSEFLNRDESTDGGLTDDHNVIWLNPGLLDDLMHELSVLDDDAEEGQYDEDLEAEDEESMATGEDF